MKILHRLFRSGFCSRSCCGGDPAIVVLVANVAGARVLPAIISLGLGLGLGLATNFMIVGATAAQDQPDDCVILLHGLARSANSMEKLADRLSEVGYRVANIDYPSREKPVAELALLAVESGLQQCRSESGSEDAIHFVTHSMGGILVRQYLAGSTIPELSRVVMLAPPNQGSEVVDEFRDIPGFEWLNGPAGRQLGTGEDDVPRSLAAVDFDLGVIAGTRTINLLLSIYLPEPNDGKVSVQSAQVEGMCDFMTVPVSHPFIMRNDSVIEQVKFYLQQGRFDATASGEKKSVARGKHCTASD